MSTHIEFLSPIEFVFVDIMSALFHMDAEYVDIRKLEADRGQLIDVDGVIKDSAGNQIGICKVGKDKCKLISGHAKTAQARRTQSDLFDAIRQRYAYDRVMRELKSQGYVITGEKEEAGNTIKITARKY